MTVCRRVYLFKVFARLLANVVGGGLGGGGGKY